MPLLDELTELNNEALEQLRSAKSARQLEDWRIRYLGSKGQVKAILRRLKEVPAEQKRQVGQVANELKTNLQNAYERAADELTRQRGKGGPAETVDVTLPGTLPRLGHVHVITQTMQEICEIFTHMGFEVVYGPEVEDAWHSFDALNTPPEHPARDPLDSYYIDEDTILRSQTSPVQIRVMESRRPPVRIIAPGRVYRPDTVDASHYFMFHQVEGLHVDEGVSMADLKTCVDQFCKAYFGDDVSTRFRPHFFPFTEPSAEVDVTCSLCGGKGCSVCKDGWVELAGSGVVDPNVLEAVGYDSERYTGYAFGFGIDRMICVRHGIPDIRLLFESDVRFLHQF